MSVQATTKRPSVLQNSSPQGVGLSIASFRRRRLSAARLTFAGLVVVPTVITAIYCFAFMSDRYVAEASFLVRGMSSHQATGLTAIFRTFGISRADDDSFAVENYLQSRDALRDLKAKLPVQEYFSRPAIDAISRFPRPWQSRSFESLFEYYLAHVTVIRNSSSGIAVLRVTAFSGPEAKEMADALLKLAEKLVNRMNARSQQDSIAHSRNVLLDAEKRVLSSQVALTDFRNREQMVDPSLNSSKTLEIIGKLALESAQAETQLSELRNDAPNSPSISSLKGRIAALQSEIARERAKLAGSDDRLAAKISTYEQLTLNRAFADRELSAAWGAMQTVQQEARRQQIYIESISGPGVPDVAIEPRRFRIVITVFAFTSAIFAMVWFLFSAAKEHVYG